MQSVQFNWDLIWNIVVLAVWAGQARWVYLDAEAKYGRGLFFGLGALFLPIAGLLFYLLYRESSLVEMDMFDAEISLEMSDTVQVRSPAHERPRQRRSSSWFRERRTKATRSEKLHAKELREKAAGISESNPLYAKELLEKADMIDPPVKRKPRKPLRRRIKEAWVVGRDKAEIRLKRWGEHREYMRRPKRLRQYEKFAEKLKETPLVDPTMEGLLFEGQYETARERAIINLKVALETGDDRKRITYRRYLDQIDKITHLYFPEVDELSEDVPKFILELAKDPSEE